MVHEIQIGGETITSLPAAVECAFSNPRRWRRPVELERFVAIDIVYE